AGGNGEEDKKQCWEADQPGHETPLKTGAGRDGMPSSVAREFPATRNGGAMAKEGWAHPRTVGAPDTLWSSARNFACRRGLASQLPAQAWWPSEKRPILDLGEAHDQTYRRNRPLHRAL